MSIKEVVINLLVICISVDSKVVLWVFFSFSFFLHHPGDASHAFCGVKEVLILILKIKDILIL